MTKERINLDLPELGDLSGFKPRSKPADDTGEAVKEVAKRHNFTARHAAPKEEEAQTGSFDARSLRRTNRTAKLNVALTAVNRERFWMLAQRLGTTSGDETLVAMVDACEAALDRAGER